MNAVLGADKVDRAKAAFPAAVSFGVCGRQQMIARMGKQVSDRVPGRTHFSCAEKGAELRSRVGREIKTWQ